MTNRQVLLAYDTRKKKLFIVVFSTNIFNDSLLQTLDIAVYKWPLLNKGVSIYTPHFCTVCPCDLFIVTQKDNLIGNCLLLNKNCDSFSSGYKLIRGMNIVCPFCGPDKTLASITYCLIVLTINRVPLHNPFKFRINSPVKVFSYESIKKIIGILAMNFI